MSAAPPEMGRPPPPGRMRRRWRTEDRFCLKKSLLTVSFTNVFYVFQRTVVMRMGGRLPAVQVQERTQREWYDYANYLFFRGVLKII